VDFARTRYIDSSGLGVLVAMAKKVKQERGTLRLHNLDEDLKTLFELTKLDTLFQYETGGDDSAAADAVPAGPRSPSTADSAAQATRDEASLS
jgi:anti-sigma B factor antagonist